MRQGETAHHLRQAGLRVTAPRFTVMEWLAEHPHATADQIGDGVRERLGSVSVQGVYDVLAACVEAGLVRKIQPAGHPARFERRTGDNHHHLVCRACGEVVDADCAVGGRPCLEPKDDHGFVLDEAEVVFWGNCPTCRSRAPMLPQAPVEEQTEPRGDRRHARSAQEVAPWRATTRNERPPTPESP